MNAVEKRSDGFHSWLPEEIVQDILSRLPVKSLKRFESACSSWSFLFRTRYFINKHLCRTRKKPCLLLHHPSSELDDNGDVINNYSIYKESLVVEPAPYFFNPNFKIMGSYNGILCVGQDSSLHKPPEFLLWNPALGQTRRLTECTKCLGFEDGYYSRCAFHLTGFGCDSVYDYKFVVLHFVDKEFDFFSEAIACEVYSCVAHSWSTSCVRALKNLVLGDESSVSLSGRLYWLGIELVDGKLIYSHGILLAFDLNINAFEKIGMPDPLNVNHWKKLCIYKENSLAVFCVRNSVFGNLVDLWVASDGLVCTGKLGPLWTLLFTIEEPQPFSSGYSILFFPFIMWGDEIVFNAYTLKAFLLVNHKTLKETVGVGVLRFFSGGGLCAFDYFESLVPVSMDSEKETIDSEMHIWDIFS